MDTDEKRTTSRCKKLHELPPVLTDWQQTAWCPECDYYDCGICVSPIRSGGNAACPFDGRSLPLREVTVDTPDDERRNPIDVGSCEAQERQPRFKALEQAIKLRIVERTGRRIQALAIELTDRELVVRGTAPCYHVKQLALQEVLDVLRSEQEFKVGFNLQVVVCPPGDGPSRAPNANDPVTPLLTRRD